MAQLEIVNPVAEAKADRSATDRFQEAPRPKSLEGKAIGLYWNAKSGGSVALARTREHLSRLYPNTRFKDFYGDQGTFMRRASTSQVEQKAREVDAMVGTTAD